MMRPIGGSGVFMVFVVLVLVLLLLLFAIHERFYGW